MNRIEEMSPGVLQSKYDWSGIFSLFPSADKTVLLKRELLRLFPVCFGMPGPCPKPWDNRTKQFRISYYISAVPKINIPWRNVSCSPVLFTPKIRERRTIPIGRLEWVLNVVNALRDFIWKPINYYCNYCTWNWAWGCLGKRLFMSNHCPGLF